MTFSSPSPSSSFALCPYYTENLPKTKQDMPTLPGFVLPHSKDKGQRLRSCPTPVSRIILLRCRFVLQRRPRPSGCAHDPNACYHTVHVCAINATSWDSQCCICVWRRCWLGRGWRRRRPGASTCKAPVTFKFGTVTTSNRVLFETRTDGFRSGSQNRL